jgi:Glycosyltransferase family 87
VSDGKERAAGNNRALVWTATACITVSLLIMVVMAAAGPSVAVPNMAHPFAGPPYWFTWNPGPTLVLLILWATGLTAAAGIAVGLVAVARGWRPPAKRLLGASFLVIAAFTVLPPAGSTDALSYAIDGNMVVLRQSPYVMTPGELLKKYPNDPIAQDSPQTWLHTLSDYGPLATAEEWISAELGGTSKARITFWLKLWTAVAFGAVTLILDRLLRSDPAMRLRAILLWALNPLLLWEIVAAGHIDGLAVAFGLAGIAVLRVPQSGVSPGLRRAVAAGVLIGAAMAVKAPFALFALGAVWALRRRLVELGAFLAGVAVVVIPSYVIAGTAAISALFNRSNEVTWDNLYQLFWRPFGYTRFYDNVVPPHLDTVATVAFVAVALLLFFRLPSRVPELPALTPSLAFSIAWIFLWPFQRPWYDAMIIALLVLYPASRLDWVVLVRLCFAAITYMEAISATGWLQSVQLFIGHWVTSSVRLLAVVAVIWLCVTGRWGWRSVPAESARAAPELQPLT